MVPKAAPRSRRPATSQPPKGAASIIKAAGDVDILVNNVGVFEIKDAFDIPDEDWQRLFDDQCAFRRAFYPALRSAHARQRVRPHHLHFLRNPASDFATEMIHYGFTKAADLALMRGFAQALAASGVTVNAVLPGPTHTEGVDAMFKSMGQSADDP